MLRNNMTQEAITCISATEQGGGTYWQDVKILMNTAEVFSLQSVLCWTNFSSVKSTYNLLIFLTTTLGIIYKYETTELASKMWNKAWQQCEFTCISNTHRKLFALENDLALPSSRQCAHHSSKQAAQMLWLLYRCWKQAFSSASVVYNSAHTIPPTSPPPPHPFLFFFFNKPIVFKW